MRVLLLLLFALAVSAYDKVMLKDVRVLTLHRGQMTTSRRVSPMSQLTCVGGVARGESHRVDIVQCTNTGYNGRDYSWKCEAQLPGTLKLGRLSVSCEGYDSPNDPFVLVGSCGLKYELEYTEKQFLPPVRMFQPPVSTTYTTRTYPVYGRTDEVLATLFLATIIIALVLMCGCCIPSQRVVRTQTYYPPTHMQTTHVPVSTSPNVIVVPQQQSSTSAFFDGMAVGSMAARPYYPPMQTHTHTETVVVQPSAPVYTSDSRDDTHTSTSFGDTERR